MNRWSSMKARVEDYLQARRALGFQLRIEGQQLQRFAAFSEQQSHHGPLTMSLAISWANATQAKSAIGPARRLEPLRPFAKYCALFEPDTEIPPSRLLGSSHRRITPHIYSVQELSALLNAARHLQPVNGLRPVTMRCLLGLLAASGLRVSEALKLQCNDVDLIQGILTIRQTKFHKSRYVPLHPTTVVALREYAAFRDSTLGQPGSTAFFLFDNHRAVNYEQAHYAFSQIRTRLGWNTPGCGTPPRLYDLRHTFACRRLLAWYAEGVDVNWAIPHLATYLGHSHVSNTYWYLTGIPELLAVAADRFEQFTCPDSETRS